MGTRHFQKVISKEGEVILAQYGQWDGYPSGQGVDILDFLRRADIDEYESKLKSIRTISDKEVDALDDDWGEKYPYLSRDCGAKIHQMVMDGVVEFKYMTDEQEANKWCEGFYTINLKDNVFITEFHGVAIEVSLDDIPRKEKYLSMFAQAKLIQDSDFVDDLVSDVQGVVVGSNSVSIPLTSLAEFIEYIKD